MRERAFELLGGDFGLIKSLRVNQVADGFCLGEINASVEKGAHGEFAGLGEASAASESEFNNMAKDHGRSVGGDFDDVVGGIGMRLGEVGDYDFVYARCRALLGRTGVDARPHTISPHMVKGHAVKRWIN